MPMTIISCLDLVLIRKEKKEKSKYDITLSIYKQIFSLFSNETHRSSFFLPFRYPVYDGRRWEKKKKGAVSLSVLIQSLRI